MNNPSIVRNPSKCIKCGRCVNVCEQVQGISALTYSNRSDDFRVTTAFNTPLDSTACVLCGQCSVVCPTAAIVERDNTHDVFNVLHDPNKHVIVQVAPSVRVALGDEFGLPPGSLVTGKMVSALFFVVAREGRGPGSDGQPPDLDEAPRTCRRAIPTSTTSTRSAWRGRIVY